MDILNAEDEINRGFLIREALLSSTARGLTVCSPPNSFNLIN